MQGSRGRSRTGCRAARFTDLMLAGTDQLFEESHVPLTFGEDIQIHGLASDRRKPSGQHANLGMTPSSEAVRICISEMKVALRALRAPRSRHRNRRVRRSSSTPVR